MMKEPGVERLERELLLRIRWDKNLSQSDYSVKYLDRVSKTLVEIPYDELSLKDGFIQHGDSLIPMHRVRQILRKGKVIWGKRRND